MKKLCFVAIAILLVCVAFVPSVASADETAAHNATYKSENGRFYVTSLTKDGAVVGAKFSGYYFGEGGIAVVAEIYSSEQLVIDFYFGDADWVSEDRQDSSGCYLSQTQTAAKAQLLQIFSAIDLLITQVDECANTQYDGSGNLPSSDIFRYNAASFGETLQISAQTYEMLVIAREMYLATDGAFNPAVYRLVDLWGFSSRVYYKASFAHPQAYDRVWQKTYTNGYEDYYYPLPDEKYIEAFSSAEFTDFSATAVDFFEEDGKYYVTKNVKPVTVDGAEYQQWLDFGGIAKGYVVDQIKVLLQQNGLERYYVDAGNSSSVYGLEYDGGTTLMGLQDPENLSAALLGWNVGKSSVSTSGQYIRKYSVDGVEYAHIIDGSTGAPAQTGVTSVLVSVPESSELWAARCDCLTTALTVMGKDKIVEFVNGYLKQNNITVVVVFQTFDGKKEICSNLSENEIALKGENFSAYAWALQKDEQGNFFYNAYASFDVQNNRIYKIIGIAAVSVLGACVVAAVVYHFAKGKKSVVKNVRYARSEKPFKPADVGVYLSVVLLIAVLFAAFLGRQSASLQTVTAVDIQTGEELFFYNVARNEYKLNEQNSNGWQITVEQTSSEVLVTFSRELDGTTHFNVLKITRGNTPSVKMVDSLCGYHRDCVQSFGEVKKSGGVIVCSPNRLKITTN